MADVAGSLGEGKLIVLQPAFGGGPGIEVAIGLARWWTRQFQRAGRDTNWFMMGVPGTANPRQLQVLDAWPEHFIGEHLVAHLHARFGLAPEFRPRGTSTEISVRLFEVTAGGRIHAIDTWAFDGDNLRVPAFAFEVVEAASRRLGVRPLATSWQHAFDCRDAMAAMYFLAALGAVSLLEERFSTGPELAIETLVGAFAAAPTMQPAVLLMEDLLAAMVSACDASELALAGALRRGRVALGRSPSEWDGIIERVLGRRKPAGTT